MCFLVNFIADFIGRGELSERQQRLGQLLNQFKKLSERHNIAVVYTNMYFDIIL